MKMRIVLLLLLSPILGWGQSTTVSAIVTDSDGFIWANGNVTLTLIPNPAYPNLGSYIWTGGVLTTTQTFSLDATGSFSQSIPSNTAITPVGSMWGFTLCPNATTGCVKSGPIQITGASQSLTATLSAVATGPRFVVQPKGYGYGTIEVSSPRPGDQFQSTLPSDLQFYTYSGNPPAWVARGAGGGGTVTAGQLALGQYPSTSQTVINPSNFTYDAATGNNLTIPGSGIVGISPQIDARFYGMVADQPTTNTDNTTAITNAINAANNTQSSSGTVLLPCQNGCAVVSGPSVLPAVTKQTTILLQGDLYPSSTLVIPNFYDIKCGGGTSPGQFQWAGQTCKIHGPQASGTLGTAITSTNTPVSFTPTYTLGSAANMQSNSAITVAETESCPATAVTRTLLAGSFNPHNATPGNVTATFAANACTWNSSSYNMRIPGGALITITGCTDSTLNSPTGGLFATYADYVTHTLVWKQAGSASGPDATCTVSGFVEDSFETVRITSCPAGVCSATFAHTHASGATWGMVAIASTYNSLVHHGFYGVSVTDAIGASFWGDFSSGFVFQNVNIVGTQNITSIPMEFANAYAFTIDNSVIQPFLPFPCPTLTVSNCSQASYPYGIRFTALPASLINAAGIGGGFIRGNTTVSGGIKLDTNLNNVSAEFFSPLVFEQGTIEQPINNTITIDPRLTVSTLLSTYAQPIVLDTAYMQDNEMGYTPHQIDYTDTPSTTFRGSLIVRNMGTLVSQAVQGPHYNGFISVTGEDRGLGVVLPVRVGTSTGVMIDGEGIKGEMPDSGANMGFSLIPHATLSVTASPTCSGSGCSIVTGILAPDGTTNAIELDSGSAAAATATLANESSASTAAGDWFCGDVWTQPGTNSNNTPIFTIQSFGGDVFDNGQSSYTSPNYQMQLLGDWWHPVVFCAKVTTGNASSHAVTLIVNQNTFSAGTQVYKWAFWHVHASESIPDQEILRWRQALMHSIVPPSMPSGGALLAIDPSYKLYFGSDTNISRTGAGVVKINGSWDSTNGPLCNGSAGSSGNLMSSGGSGAACSWISAGSAIVTNVPPWLLNLGTGADGANTTDSGNRSGVWYYTNYTVPFGNTVTVNNALGLTIHATGTCTIAGTITTNVTNNGTIYYGASSGGSGGGTAAGTVGTGSNALASLAITSGGTAGASSGGNGSNGAALTAQQFRAALDGGLGQDGLAMGGAPGKAGGSSGGAGGNGAPGITFICGSITGTDGTHTGTIDGSGKPGVNPTANTQGAGSGGAGGIVILSSHAAIGTAPNVYTTGGAGAINVVPQAVATLGSCTTQPVVSLGVTTGAFSSCTVVTAGTGCGTGTGITWKFQGGGGTQTTAAINPTFSGGALASCTVTAGDSAGYTASTFTTSGNGGQGGNGQQATFTW